MPIAVQCSCGKTLTAPDSKAGKKGTCPACQAVLDIPAEPSALLADFRAAVRAEVAAIRFRLGLLAVLGMVALGFQVLFLWVFFSLAFSPIPVRIILPGS